MSTYYQVGCDDCKTSTGVISRNKDMQAPKEVYEFMFEHEGHNLIFYSEYDDTRYTSYDSDFKSYQEKYKSLVTAVKKHIIQFHKLANIQRDHLVKDSWQDIPQEYWEAVTDGQFVQGYIDYNPLIKIIEELEGIELYRTR